MPIGNEFLYKTTERKTSQCLLCFVEHLLALVLAKFPISLLNLYITVKAYKVIIIVILIHLDLISYLITLAVFHHLWLQDRPTNAPIIVEKQSSRKEKDAVKFICKIFPQWKPKQHMLY